MQSARGIGVGVAFALALVAGCAAGVEDGVEDVAYLSGTADAGADEDAASVKVPEPVETTDAGADAGDPDEGDDAGKPDAGKPAPDGGVPGGGGGTPATCNAANTCAAAGDLGSVSGDTGADVVDARGTGSKWFSVRVTENNNGFGGVKLRLKASLVTAPGTAYDLFVYLPDGDTVECTTVTRSATGASASKSTSVEFGEGGVANGSDDARTVTVEVRHASGTCAAGSEWKLVLDGNAN